MPTSGMLSGPSQSPRRGDADPKPGERARAGSYGQAVELGEAPTSPVENLGAQRQEPRRVLRALARGLIIPSLEELAVRTRQGHRGGPGGGVDPEDPARDHDLRMVTRRSSPPACSICTRAAIRPRAPTAASPCEGHSTKAMVSGRT